jgi:protein-disulfide isomerase
MKFNKIALSAILAAQLGWSANPANLDVKGVEKIVHDYLLQNPEILIEASQALQAKQQTQMQAKANTFIQQNAKQLIDEKIAVVGAPNANVTIVEFFDYQCGHCSKMNPIMKELLKDNDSLKVVYREFPIFGNTSAMASKAALAAGMQGKYAPMQQALFGLKKIDEKAILELAKTQGLDLAKFQNDMKSQTVADTLSNNRKLAESMKLFGTPVFIILSTPNGEVTANMNPVLIPGSTSKDKLAQLIKSAAETK